MSGKGGFGHFSSSTRYGKREDTPEEFKERFRKNVARINALSSTTARSVRPTGRT